MIKTQNVTKCENLCEHIYLIREREFARLDEPVYKIGRSVNIHNRMNQYPKDSEIYLFEAVDNSIWYEKELISIFEDMYERAKVPSGETIEKEYFIGNIDEMIYVVRSFIMNHYSGKISSNSKNE